MRQRGDNTVAVGIVDKEGMEAVSVRRIAKELGVSSMTIYNYVENLSDVKKRVLISGFDRMYGCIYEALNAPPRGGRAGSSSAGPLPLEVFRFARNNPEMFKYMFTDGRQAFHADAEVRPFYAFFSKFMKRGKSSKGDWRSGEKSCKLFETLVFYPVLPELHRRERLLRRGIFGLYGLLSGRLYERMIINLPELLTII